MANFLLCLGAQRKKWGGGVATNKLQLKNRTTTFNNKGVVIIHKWGDSDVQANWGGGGIFQFTDFMKSCMYRYTMREGAFKCMVFQGVGAKT